MCILRIVLLGEALNDLRIIYLGREYPLSRLEAAMKPWLKWTGLILIAAVFGLALAFAFTVAVKPQRGQHPDHT